MGFVEDFLFDPLLGSFRKLDGTMVKILLGGDMLIEKIFY